MIDQILNEKTPALVELYRHLHAHPELSFHEVKTAARLAAELKAAGFEVHEKIGGHGVVGVLKNGPGPCVMVRTDLDALPIVEQTLAPFASKVKVQDAEGADVGVMHACGHDMHMTTFVGAGTVLSRMRSQWSGTLLFVGQPAEERGSGARMMLEDGLFTRFPRPDFALAFHVNANLPSGTIGYCPGPALASVDSIDITFRGIGGHGAYPHTTKDPIVLAAQFILAVQTIVSREIAPTEPAVVTVGSIHGGSKHNIIPDEVKVQLTCRAYSDTVRSQILAAVARIAENLARAAGLPEDRLPVVKLLEESIPATINDHKLTELAAASARRVLGESGVVVMPSVMGGEDFGLFGRETPSVPICMLWLGAVEPAVYRKAKAEGRSLPSLHSPFFLPDQAPTLETGVRVMSSVVMDLLPKPR